MRVTFLGNDPWSVPSLEALAASTHDVGLVVTREPRPAGRGGKLRPTAVAEAAHRVGLPVAEVATVRSGPGLEAIRESRPEVLAVVAYGEIVPPEVLEVPSVAPVNLHFSLLPALRGADPVRRAILEGFEVTGVTTMRMDEGMDTGPVLLSREEQIREDDDAGSLGARLAEVGGRLLVETIDRLEMDGVEGRPQDHDAATVAGKLRLEDEWLRWDEPAAALARRVRAMAPDPGAKARFRGKVLKVLRARPIRVEGRPGTVVAAPGTAFAVAAGEGALALEEVVPEGKSRMTGEAFARGRRPEPGETLG